MKCRLVSVSNVNSRWKWNELGWQPWRQSRIPGKNGAPKKLISELFLMCGERKIACVESAKIAVFVDAGNLWSSYKELDKLIDFKKLKTFIPKHFNLPLFRFFYYVAYPPEGTREKVKTDSFHKFLTFLERGLSFTIVKKELKTIFLRDKKGNFILDKDGNPETKEKGNFDVELTMDVLHNLSAYNTAVLFTGDSDFLPLITYLRSIGKKVYVFSTNKSVSYELRTGADGYFDIADYPKILKPFYGSDAE